MRTVPRIIALHLGHLSIMSEQLSQQIISAHGRNSVCIASALHLLQIIEAFNLSFSDLKHCNRSVLDETAQHGLGICSIAKQRLVFGPSKFGLFVCGVVKFVWRAELIYFNLSLLPKSSCGTLDFRKTLASCFQPTGAAIVARFRMRSLTRSTR